MYTVLLIVAIGIVGYTSLKGRTDYRKFEKKSSGMSLEKLYKTWVQDSWLLFGGFSLVTFLLIGIDRMVSPIARNTVELPSNINTDDIAGVITGVVMGVIVVGLILFWKMRKSVQKSRDTVLSPLAPRSPKERQLAPWVAITAGITEETFYRGAMPWLVFLVSNDATYAIVASVLLFGIEHLYQGWRGVVGTAFIGWLLMKLYLLTGTIAVPIVVHTLIDLYAFVVVPAIHRRASKSR